MHAAYVFRQGFTVQPRLAILLPCSFNCWDYRCAPQHPANCSHLCTTIVSLKTKQHKNKEKTYFGYSRSPPADDFQDYSTLLQEMSFEDTLRKRVTFLPSEKEACCRMGPLMPPSCCLGTERLQEASVPGCTWVDTLQFQNQNLVLFLPCQSVFLIT